MPFSVRKQSPFIDQVWWNHISVENRFNCDCFVSRIGHEFSLREQARQFLTIESKKSDYHLKKASLEWVVCIIFVFCYSCCHENGIMLWQLIFSVQVLSQERNMKVWIATHAHEDIWMPVFFNLFIDLALWLMRHSSRHPSCFPKVVGPVQGSQRMTDNQMAKHSKGQR